MTIMDRPRDFLDRGHVRIALQRDLATGAMTREQLAAKYGASKSGVTAFAKRYAAVIEEIAADLENRYAGLWAADKERRIASYQADVELVEAEVDRVLAARAETMAKAAKTAGREIEADEDGEILDAQITVATDLGRLNRIKHRALRSIAEELGQLPTRMVVKSEGGGAVHVYGAGVDTDKV